jgi:hypothetical protein
MGVKARLLPWLTGNTSKTRERKQQELKKADSHPYGGQFGLGPYAVLVNSLHND